MQQEKVKKITIRGVKNVLNLDLANDLFNNLKDNKFVQNFINELSNYLKNKIGGDSKLYNLMDNDLTINNVKIISKYRNQMLTERANILQNYAENTKDLGEMYYIYAKSSNTENAYNLSICNKEKSNQVITKQINELPEGAQLGSILYNQNENLVLNEQATQEVENKINTMVQEKIEEQNNYLSSKRMENHIYQVGEKYNGRIWLYDLTNNTNEKEGIEEIEFPQNLYEEATEGEKFIYINGEYQKM